MSFDSFKFIPKKFIVIFLVVSGLFLYFGQSDKGSNSGFVSDEQSMESWKENPGRCGTSSNGRFRSGRDCTLAEYVGEQNTGALMVYGAIILTVGYLIWEKLKVAVKFKNKDPHESEDD